MRHRNTEIRFLKTQAVNSRAIHAVLIDGQKRYITPGVFMLQTHSEITTTGIEHKRFALHTKRGSISSSLISFIKRELYEKGWKYQSLSIEMTGVWEGTFLRIR